MGDKTPGIPYVDIVSAAIRAVGATLLISGGWSGNQQVAQAGAAVLAVDDNVMSSLGGSVQGYLDRRTSGAAGTPADRRSGMDRRSTTPAAGTTGGRRSTDNTFDPLA